MRLARISRLAIKGRMTNSIPPLPVTSTDIDDAARVLAPFGLLRAEELKGTLRGIIEARREAVAPRLRATAVAPMDPTARRPQAPTVRLIL